MRNYLIVCFGIAAVLALGCTSCRKTYTYSCVNPKFVLEQQGYYSAEWDTIITRVYNKGYLPPVITDTFIAVNLTDVLTINLDEQDLKDFEVFLPSVGRTYQLYNVEITSRSAQTSDDNPLVCYNDMTYMLDGQNFRPPNTAIIYAVLSN